ncbi:MAG: hypothetical protein RL213_2225 [Bacteroidota bacterium]|jgi:glycosyltransferase involved in cell wall biosynthesis
MRKLLLVGTDTVHVYNYIELVKGYFDRVLLVSNAINKDYRGEVVAVDFSMRHPLSIFRTPTAIRKAIEDFRPSVIHVHQANSVAWYLFRALKGRDIPVVLTAWGSDILVAPGRNIFLRRMIADNLRKATVLTSDSRHMADEMRRLIGAPSPEILIANFGIDTDFSATPKEKVIYSNRLHKPIYRIEAVLAAFSKFLSKPSNADWRLSVAAVGEETGRLKTLAADLGIAEKVTFEGWVSRRENAMLYAKAAVFVSIPESDATSISLLEAMSHGCIPVVSDLPANREWIRDGENGVIVKDVNEDFFSRVAEIDAANAAGINRDIISKEATKEVNRARFLDCYDRLLSGSATC